MFMLRKENPIVGGRYVLWRQTLRERRAAFFADLSSEITRESIAILLPRGGGRRNCDKSQAGPTASTAQLLRPISARGPPRRLLQRG
jgi:hypothetical protein